MSSNISISSTYF